MNLRKEKKKKITSRIISSFEKSPYQKLNPFSIPPQHPKKNKIQQQTSSRQPWTNKKKKKKFHHPYNDIPTMKIIDAWSATGIDNVSIIDNRDHLLEDAAAKFTTGGTQFVFIRGGGLTIFLFPPPSRIWKLLT